MSDYFSSAEVSLEFFGASELIELHRKTRVILELPYAEQLSGEQGAFVLLVPITAYAHFVSDEHGNLRRYLFDSNVRDFLGSNRVNQDIAGSLLDRDSPDFWWLNNGVTILATSALPLGRTPAGNAIQLHDVQIVNGLQTTQTIHSYIQSYDGASETRCVLVKVIVSEDSAVRDKIIEATNNQTSVELAALNATDKIQRDIEQILERNQWYYERRKNYYKNIGKPAERFVTPLWLAASVVALLKRAPHAAGQLKNRFMRNQVSYRAVFSDRLPIEVWPRLVGIMKAVEFGIVAAVPRLTAGQASFLKSARGAVALCAVARLRGTFDIDAQTLLAMDPQKVTSDLVWSVFECLYGLQHVAASSDTALQYPHSRVRKLDRLCVRLGELEGILGTAVIGRWVLPTGAESKRRASGKPADAPWSKTTTHTAIVSDEVLAKVDAELPEQPWPPGIQQKVAEALGFDRKTVAGAIKQLMESGKRYWQRMGVAIDHEGIVVAVDRKRAAAHHIVGKPYSGE